MTVEIARQRRPEDRLPKPLGDIRDEWRIDRATARAYQVAKGDYIQIIDVEGRQCSDFMAMRAEALERGLERHIDSTVTRTVVGGAYPGPGPVRQILRSGHASALEGRSGYCRASRHLCARLYRARLRGARLSRPCELLRQYLGRL